MQNTTLFPDEQNNHNQCFNYNQGELMLYCYGNLPAYKIDDISQHTARCTSCLNKVNYWRARKDKFPECLQYSAEEFLQYCQSNLPTSKVLEIDQHTTTCPTCLKKVNYWHSVYNRLRHSHGDNLTLDIINAVSPSTSSGWVLANGWVLMPLEQLRKLVQDMEDRLRTSISANTVALIAQATQLIDQVEFRLNKYLPQDCPHWRRTQFLNLYHNKLSREESKPLTLHLSRCPHCQTHYYQLVQELKDLENANYPILHQHLTKVLKIHSTKVEDLAIKYEYFKQFQDNTIEIIQNLAQILQQLEHNKEERNKDLIDLNNRFANLANQFANYLTNEENKLMISSTLVLEGNEHPTLKMHVPTQPQLANYKHFAAAGVIISLLITSIFYLGNNNPQPNNLDNMAVTTTNFNTAEEQDVLLTPASIDEIEKLTKKLKLDRAQALLTPTLKKAQDTNDKVAEARLLYLQGRIFSEKADFQQAISTLNKSISIGKGLNQPSLLLGPVMNLAGIYHIIDQNEEAVAKANACLSLATQTNNTDFKIISLQLLAISQFLAYKAPNAEKLIIQSITLAQQQRSNDRIVQAYIYLGVINTHKRQFAKATNWFEQALITLNTVSDTQTKAYLGCAISGYYARCQTLARKFKEASTLYNIAINQAHQIGVKQYLAISQFQQGLAECYQNLGNQYETQKAQIKADAFREEAERYCQIANTALSFAPEPTPAKQCN
jgi:tetratricopeptide (TPR) repeat protein